jgi:pyruvate/2-oxoglutarate dehydrogenase complex dihydrolipoamide acyltransferase (E2) component
MEYKDLIIPKLDVNDNKVTIENLRFENLDFVENGEILYTVSTSKSVEDYETDFSGYIVFFVRDGDDVEVGKSAGMIFKDKNQAEIKLHEIKLQEFKVSETVVKTNVSKKAIEYAKQINFDLSLIKKDGIIKTQDIDDYLKNS